MQVGLPTIGASRREARHCASSPAISRAAGWPRPTGRGCGRRPTSCARRSSTCSARSVAGARVLDGYAGTGAVGIEALSRGAAHVTFVDSDRRATDARRGQPAPLRPQRGLCYYPRGFCAASGRGSTATAVRHHLSRPSLRRGGDGVGARSGRRTRVGRHAGHHRAREARRAAGAGGHAGADAGSVVRR